MPWTDLACPYRAVKVEDARFRLAQVSRTFHGRDVFAPAAAHLSKSPHCFSELGDELGEVYALTSPELSMGRQRLVGEVLHIDHFGNIITSIGALHWQDEATITVNPYWEREIPKISFHAADAQVTIHSHTIHGVSHAYHEVAPGTILAQIDSNGFLEIGANLANAAARLDVQLGDKVMLKL